MRVREVHDVVTEAILERRPGAVELFLTLSKWQLGQPVMVHRMRAADEPAGDQVARAIPVDDVEFDVQPFLRPPRRAAHYSAYEVKNRGESVLRQDCCRMVHA